MKNSAFVLSLTILAGTASAQDFLLIVNSTSDQVLKADPVTGAYISDFCTMPVTGSGATPKEALQVGTEVWVSDQLQDNIVAFDASGTFIGEVVGRAQGLDNVRGFEVTDGKIWVTCGSGTFLGHVVVFSQATREFLFSVNVTGSPFDCKRFGDEILVTNSDTHDVDRIGLDGTILGKFVDSVAIDQPLDFPQQLDLNGREVAVAEFANAFEIFQFDHAGTLLRSIDTAPVGGLRGIHILASGGYIFTNGSGTYVYEEGAVRNVISGGSFQYINLYRDVCAADFNGDGFLDFFDYDDYVNCFESGNCPAGRTADFNGDNFVDFFDYDDFVSAFETGC